VWIHIGKDIMKKIALFLALIMLLSAFLMTGCDSEPQATGEKTSDSTAATTEETKEELFYGFPLLEKRDDMEGFELIFYSRGEESGYGAWKTVDLISTERTDEPINDAVYERNQRILENYGIKISEIVSPKAQAAQAAVEIKAGQNAYNVIIADGKSSASLGEAGYLCDLKTAPNLVLEGPWWDQYANKDLSIGGKLYFTTGDLSISAMDATWVTFFNKTVHEENNIENLYDLVKEDKWTIDKVVEITKGLASDVNNDGQYNASDMYGYAYEPFNNYALFHSLGCSIISKDEEDFPQLSVYSAASQEIFEIIRDISDNDEEFYQDWSSAILNIQKENRALLSATTMYTIRAQYRHLEQDYGLLPMPKYEADDNYVNVVSVATCGSLYSIPTTFVDDLDRISYALELVCRESKDTVRNAYYDVSLQGLVVRDEESLEMLDIIFNNRRYDLAIIYDWGGWYTYFYNLWRNKASDFASTYDRQKEMTNTAIEGTIDAYLSHFD